MRSASPARAGAALLALVLVVPQLLAQDGTWALTNARIETVTRGVIERGTIVIRDGLIAAVGADVPAPADARVLDLAGRTVYPGLIDLISTLGLPAAAVPAAGQGAGGQGAQPAATAAGATYVGLEPHRMVVEELRPNAGDVRAARDAGITAVLAAPARGAFRGMSALLPTRDSVAARHVIKSPVALHMGFQGTGAGFGGGGGGGAGYPATLLGVIAYERQALYDARRHGMLLDRYRQNPRGMERPPVDERLAALVPVVRGELPAFFAAGNENEIRRAIGIAREFGLNLTIVGGAEAFRATDALRTGRTPVVVSVDYPNSPSVIGWAYRNAQRHAPGDSAQADSAVKRLVEGNAAALNRAGIRIALSSGGTLRPPDFMANVRKAIAAGLPRDTALAAMTIRPAEMAGVGDQLGSIETGKIANLVVGEGDLLGDSARVRMVFVDGIRYEVIPPATPARGAGAGGGRGGRGGGGAAAEAADVAGIWDVSTETPQGTMQGTLTLTQSGPNVTGSMTSQLGTVEVQSGLVEGRSLTFTISPAVGGQTITVSYRATIDGANMSGTASVGEFGSFTFTGTKRTP